MALIPKVYDDGDDEKSSSDKEPLVFSILRDMLLTAIDRQPVAGSSVVSILTAICSLDYAGHRYWQNLNIVMLADRLASDLA